MLFYISLYVGLGLVMVAAMALMILKIGKLLGDCPVSGSAPSPLPRAMPWWDWAVSS
ncbi:hypothetical protein [Roseobacter sp. MED193]|uniref:hypothetical protein n=1 Tax=Roseobacter sp. MED193 TaxID=314262 RepID=UPI0012EEC7CE|nr:hypothetical protein [Roseobacter sp. MED193]